jgi:hypothetical protein
MVPAGFLFSRDRYRGAGRVSGSSFFFGKGRTAAVRPAAGPAERRRAGP